LIGCIKPGLEQTIAKRAGSPDQSRAEGPYHDIPQAASLRTMVSSLEAKADESALDDAEAMVEIDPRSLSSTTTSLGSYCRRWEIMQSSMRISWS
jgi:hypothetical protein